MGSNENVSGLTVDLLPGEHIDEPAPTQIRQPSDAELNERYTKEGVRIVTESARYPLHQIRSMFSDTFETESGDTEFTYKRDPDYQRRHRWDDTRKSRLIESFLLNVPVPPIFLYENDLARYEVMDGRQRLSALLEFYTDALELTDLQYWPELNGRRYTSLPTSIRNGIDRRYLSSIILLNETATSEEQAAFLKKLVFERLNSGGVRLTSQETRNAIYSGPMNDLCLELSRIAELRAMLGTPDPELATPWENRDDDPSEDDADTAVSETNLGRKMFETMEDVEIVLRFFAYRHLRKFPQGLNRISEFLDTFLMKANKFDASTIAGYKEIFTENMKFWYALGGPTAFQVPGSNRHFSKIAFDALMYASSALTAEQRSALLNSPETVHEATTQMYATHRDTFGGRKTNTVDAHRRNDAALVALNAALTRI
ncbi:hypothetical protein MABM_23020 [Mycobacteroides abscessus]|uniref:DUF262 domain-containing protein n=1 Tax=Mycobacteroides abscessus TaxID=36809 RepID=UPI0003A9BF8E|nr:DUF262 domain-containing protein [Mycobacteroides abscessus]BBZ82386.1 hypothetical protein MABM_23020 [Mycobacteroides abscessus]